MNKLKSKDLIYSIVFLVGFLSINIQGQSISKVGTAAASFLKIGAGARSLAMGEAVVSNIEDVTSMYWNPAGLALMQKNQVVFNHYDFIADLNYEYAGVAIVMPEIGTVAASFTYLGAPDIERTTYLRQEGTGEMVSSSFYSFGLGFARMLTNRFAIGGNIKYIQENLWHTSSTGFALDIGISYTTLFKGLKIGMSMSNFGTSMQLEGRDLAIQHDIASQSDGNNGQINGNLATDEFPLPVLFRFGISSNITKDFFEMEDHDFVVAVDALHPNDNKEYLNVGGEYFYNKMFALRAGHRQLLLEDSEGGFTFGFGLHYDIDQIGVNLDYAASDFGRLDYVNKFTFILTF